MEFDRRAETKVARAFNLDLLTGSSNGLTVDTQGFRSAEVVIGVSNFGGTANIFVESSSDGTTWTRVPAEEMVGRDSAFTAAGHIALSRASGHFNCRVGIISKDRYLRLVHTQLTATSTFGALVFVLGHAIHRPTSPQLAA